MAAVCLMLVVWTSTPSAALAQIGAGALSGRVTDQSGTGVPGAMVTVTSVGTNSTGTGITDVDGAYFVQGLAPGAYRVQIELSGFRPVTREGVRLVTGETIRLDILLQVGGLTEAVTVTADASQLRSETSGLGHVVDNTKIVGLPLNGRSFVTLAGLLPGVALPPNSSLPRINGGRPRTNEYLFDGVSVLQPEPGQVAFFPNIDAIQEFKIETNSPPAEFGRFNGGVVNLTTKAGTNTIRGTAFEFLRNEALNARNFFASTDPVKPKFRRNQFGGVAGGPIRQNSTFFFVDYQGQRQTIARTAISTVPTLLQRQGIFTEAIGGRVPQIFDPATTTPNGSGGFTRTQFNGNSIPAERIDQVARTLLDHYPLPTSGGAANNYRRVADETVNQDQFNVRIDQHFPGNRDQVFGRLTRFSEEFIPVTPLSDGSGVTAGTLGPQDTSAWSFASTYQRTISSTMVNELRIGDTRRRVGRMAAELSDSASSALNLPGIPSNARFPDTLPTFLIGGYQQLGSPPNTATDFSTSVTQIADTLTWLKARHTLKMGADLRWERLNVIQPPSPTGSFTFSNLFTDQPGVNNTGTPFASFLLGQVQQFSIDLQQDQIRNRAHWEEYFIQDDWRLTSRITVNAGVRYTLNFPSTEKSDQSAIFNLETQQLEYLGRDGQPSSARQLHKFNLGPRLGVVDQPQRQDGGADRLRSGVDRAGRHHHTVYHTSLSVPADGHPTDPRQRQTCVRPRQRTERRADTADPGRRSGPRRLLDRPGSGIGIRPAVEHVSAAGDHVQHLRRTGVCRLEDHPGRHSRHQSESVDRRSAGGRPDAHATGSEPVLRDHPAFVIARRSNDLGRAADQAVSGVHDRQPLPEQRRHDDLHGFYAKLEQRFTRGLSYLVSYTRSKLRTMPRRSSMHRFSRGRWLTFRSLTASTVTSSVTTRPATSPTCSPRRQFGIFRSAPAASTRAAASSGRSSTTGR